MFLHWLAGMIFIFYLASFVMLLREVLRPGVLWFLRNLNDQNFHPIQEVGACVCVCVCGGGEGGVLGNRVKREALLLVLRLRTGNHLFLSADD